MPRRGSLRWSLVLVAAAVGAAIAIAAVPSRASRRPLHVHGRAQAIHKIRHVIMIMQENRSFDSYFGTFPGADGIPMSDGVPKVCVPDPQFGGCVRPYHDP